MTPKMRARQAAAINRIAGLVLVNAMMFQEVLAQQEKRVRNLGSFRHETNLIGALADHWKFILDEINYFPIFHIAYKLLLCISPDRAAVAAVNGLVQRAAMIVGWRASLRHDLAGRIYHRLLEDAKYLGAYYTSIPASVLLAKLALSPEEWQCDWSDLKQVSKFHVSDLACGTGTLLMAAADVIVDNHIRDSGKKERAPQLSKLHSLVVEKVLYGFDVLHSAIHLTASTLALRVPDAPINVTNLSVLPLGGMDNKLGTLEFLEGNTVAATTLFSQMPTRILGKKAAKAKVSLPELDLCIMNPPFTRSVGGNLLFGNLPIAERTEMQRRLSKLVNHQTLSASITAGLGAVFIALGDKYLKSNGRMALVLPRALLSGVAWQKTRELFNEHYHLQWIIVSHAPGHWNFSENTDLSEVLIIARKRSEAKPKERVSCVNLWQQPRNSVEALTVARELRENTLPDVYKGQGALDLITGAGKVGEAMSVPWSWLKKQYLWNFPCAFAQSELVRCLFHLRDGELYLPGTGVTSRKLKLCALSDLAELGFDVRDIHDGFKLASSKTVYPAFWDHDSHRVFTLKQASNQFLAPLATAKPGRHLRDANHLWKKAGRILIAERLRLNTARLAAVLVGRKVLSNVWWTVTLKEDNAEAEKALALWLNSSLGFLLLLGYREETEGAWGKFKKPVLGQMPVLDVSTIGARNRGKLAQAFERLAERPLLPLPEMATDPVRAEIDAAVASALGLPDFGILRQLLAREPIICLSLDRLQVPEGQPSFL